MVGSYFLREPLETYFFFLQMQPVWEPSAEELTTIVQL